MKTRDLGIEGGGAGKGDADRTDNVSAYNKNLAEIHFPGDTAGFARGSGGRLVKRYAPAPPTIFGSRAKPTVH